jgi:branched-chain amino acid transport system permease protein
VRPLLLSFSPVSVSAGRRVLAIARGDLGSNLFAVMGILAVGWVILLGIQNPKSLFETLVIGFADGCLLALIALGYTMVYGIIELINFAHGDVFTLGAFIALPLLGFFGYGPNSSFTWIALPAVLLVTVAVMLINGAINVVIERIAYRPLRYAPRLAPLITAIGMSFLIEGLMYLWQGPYSLRFPDLLPNAQLSIGSASIGVKDIIVMVSAVVLVVLLSVFINRSKLGKAMRATAQDREAAQLMGIDINRTIAATFFIGAALAGAGGMIYGLYINSVRFDLGFSQGLYAFTAAVFGGIGNIEGAALGGLLIGIIKALNERYFSGSWSDVVIFAILILTLVFRPSGLLGMRVPEK